MNHKRQRNLLLLLLALITPLIFGGCTQRTTAYRPPAETWAFCGVSPDDQYADAKTRTLSLVAGIDATFGPCNAPDWSTYSPAFPGQRYSDPETYMRVLHLNAKYGMKTVVYDARIWSTDPAEREAAISWWSPVSEWVRAWDMGDEFDPTSDQWQVLIDRWDTVLTYITPVTGVGPYTNNLPWESALSASLSDLQGAYKHLSFDAYDVSLSVSLAEQYDLMTGHLMCSINTLTHSQYTPTYDSVLSAMRENRNAGCDSFLIFGGDMPIDPTGYFTGSSLVTPTGQPTMLAEAVAKGAK